MKRYATASMLELRATVSALCFALSFCLPAFAQVSTPGRDIAEELGMEFVSIPAGSFEMGSPATEPHRKSDEGPMHMVQLLGFEMMATEVTQGMWEKVMGSNPALDYGVGSDYPVYYVSWNDCQDFIAQLNLLDTEYEYRLPSEAEWEYACRAGTTAAFYWGDDPWETDNGDYGESCGTRLELVSWDELWETEIGDYAWFYGNSGSTTQPVAEKIPNDWGLYDMSGNVWEWCEDWFHESFSGAPTDGSAWLSPAGSSRVCRGGSWLNYPPGCRSASRDFNGPGRSFYGLGLRLARSAR